MKMTTKEFKDWVTSWHDKISIAWRVGLEEESKWMEKQYLNELGQIVIVHEEEGQQKGDDA